MVWSTVPPPCRHPGSASPRYIQADLAPTEEGDRARCSHPASGNCRVSRCPPAHLRGSRQHECSEWPPGRMSPAHRADHRGLLACQEESTSIMTERPRRDPLAPEDRSRLMSRVKSSGNDSTEVRIARILRREGISGWRRNVKGLPGTPDFFFSRTRLALFVHGCFWHGCPSCYREPKSNTTFWQTKVAENRVRDRRVLYQLRARGIRTMTVWEHEVMEPGWVARRRRTLAE